MMSAALNAEAGRLRSDSPATAGNLEQTAHLFERLRLTKRFQEETWAGALTGIDGDIAQTMAVKFQRAIWALEQDLVRGVFLDFGSYYSPWDSHDFNGNRQTKWNGLLVATLSRFLAKLAATSNDHGKLSDTTAIVVGSELGRFPRLNGSEGKDHFPEIPLLFYGAGFDTQGSGASYGGTGRQMQALPVALDTGLPQRGGHTLVLDDIGTTLLHLAGVPDPAAYGYTGRILPFLV
jgi:hypothetical protein